MVAWTPVQKPWLKQNQYGWKVQPPVRPQWQPSNPFANFGGFAGGFGAGGGGGGCGGGYGKGYKGYKGAGGGGYQAGGCGGCGLWQKPRKPPPSVQSGFQVDSTARYTGTVDFYAKWKGYGFAVLQQTGIVPNDRIFIHWKMIQSDDRYPFLMKDLEVELSITKVQDRWNPNVWTLRAQNVTMVGGMNISLQDDLDAQQKTFVGGQHLRYTGTLKFFNALRGFGYVTMDQGYDVDASVPTELRVETSEVNAGSTQPRSMENLAVEFGIWKTPKGSFKVYNMTLPGGHPLTQDAVENRISLGAQGFIGEITQWNWRNGWGFIRPDPSIQLPPRALAKLQQQVAAARQRGRNITEERLLYFRRQDCLLAGFGPQRGCKVSFKIYIDDKGAGAMEVTDAGN